MSVNNIARYIVMAIIAAAIASFFYWIWSMGNTHGKEAVQSQWNQEKLARATATQLQEDLNAALEAANRLTTEKVNNDLAEAKATHAVALANIKHDYADRLRTSEQRAAIYKREAESGSSQCRDLASHTAELDRSLEEGRSLVRELRETLRLRDDSLTAVGVKLLADRKLLTSDE